MQDVNFLSYLQLALLVWLTSVCVLKPLSLVKYPPGLSHIPLKGTTTSQARDHCHKKGSQVELETMSYFLVLRRNLVFEQDIDPEVLILFLRQ